MSKERAQAAPPAGVPTTTCVEPPPTSHTATLLGSFRHPLTAPAIAEHALLLAAEQPDRAPVARSSVWRSWSALPL